MATIGQHYFKVCTRGAERSGADVTRLLAKVGLDRADFDRPGWRGDVETMSRLVQLICRSLNDEFMGFSAEKAKIGTFAMMTKFAVVAPTVLGGLQRGAEFYNYASSSFKTEIYQDAGEIVIETFPSRSDLDPDHYFIEFWMMGWHRFACWLAGEVVPIKSVELAYPAPTGYLHELSYLFPAETRFDSDGYRLHLSRSELTLPVMPSEIERSRLVERAPFDFMTMPGSDRSMARAVRVLLQSGGDVPFTALSVEEIASALDIHPVALARHLRSEGTSVNRIIQAMRRDLAVRYLVRGATVEAIAARLGYDEARSFTRAFRAWTGSSPRQYRDIALRELSS